MSPSRNVLLLGGHGKVALYLTPLLRNLGWSVTSVIRDETQKGDIEAAAGKGKGGTLTVLVRSLEDVKSAEDAKAVIEDAGGIDTVVWSAGAGGKGGSNRTYAIDRDSARHFISASLSSPSISTFLLVSALSIRRRKAPWWSDEDWAGVQNVNTQVMPHYYRAKLAADEFLTLAAKERVQEGSFHYLVLRPGGLVDGEPDGKVSFGKTRGRGTVKRADVAAVAAELLRLDQKGGRSGWFDLLAGDETVEEAVGNVLKKGVDCMEGESVEEMETDINS